VDDTVQTGSDVYFNSFLHRLVAFLLLHCSRSSATCVSSYRHHGTRGACKRVCKRVAMEYCIWKRDEAVLLVREGSIVVGASRYEPRLRCIISLRVHIIDAAVHLRRFFSYLLAPATTLPSPQTSESWRRICTA
jgi:hypothetical protein